MGAIVTYQGDVIHEAESGEVFTLNTEGCYMEGNLEVAVDEGSDLPTAEGVEF